MPEDITFPLRAFPDAWYSSRWNLLCWRPVGTLNNAVLDKVAEFVLLQEQFSEQPFHRYADMTGLIDLDVKVGDVFSFADRRRESAASIEPVKSAIVSDTVLGFGLARLYESLMNETPIRVKAFAKIGDAAAWLGVPMDVLFEGPMLKFNNPGGGSGSR